MPSPNPLQPASAPEAIQQNKPAPLPLWAGLATASDVGLNEVEVLLSLKIEAMSPSFASADQTKREEFRQLWAAIQTPLEVQVSNEKELSKLTTVLADKDKIHSNTKSTTSDLIRRRFKIVLSVWTRCIQRTADFKLVFIHQFSNENPVLV
jgi:hypothetical protein